ncbi:TetR/AcrR family transcriptional regulator [Nocardia pseudobrasiliensis]|uniref:TetR family transcriptional regulator n=1 Tax=Nocardia pseudobrasiliensis TaxID=45979 RepID=A0A370IDJ7_9NOCA|nr:TetR/AcrR family transcriptional regulator [Nocardia pseudobrasiliensis]RDI68799.1 TetR family transcriptional regulator [Nocardia pseudobrasiliensis]
MPRASRAQAESHRREVLDAAAAQVRTHGAHGVSVPQLMAAAGLTHGGFYRHFRNKEDLVAQACTAACAEKSRELADIRAAGPDPEAARRLFLERYLSVAHRDHPGQGCGLAALAGDVARAEAESPLRQAYLDGLRELVDNLGTLGERSGDEDELLVEVALMAGALMLARASAGDDLSERILRAARERLISQPS